MSGGCEANPFLLARRSGPRVGAVLRRIAITAKVLQYMYLLVRTYTLVPHTRRAVLLQLTLS